MTNASQIQLLPSIESTARRDNDRGDLADLHRDPLHVAEDIDDLFGLVDLPPLGRRLAGGL